MVGYLADSRWLFSRRDSNSLNIFNVGDDKRTNTIFSANRRNPDGIAISHKALNV